MWGSPKLLVSALTVQLGWMTFPNFGMFCESPGDTLALLSGWVKTAETAGNALAYLMTPEGYVTCASWTWTLMP